MNSLQSVTFVVLQKAVTPVNPPKADKNRGPVDSQRIENTGFRLSPE